MGNDPDANIVHFLMHRLHWTPDKYMSMDPYCQAFVRASVKIHLHNEKEGRAHE